MKKIILVLTFCLLGALLFAQEKATVVVLPFTGGDPSEGEDIADQLEGELFKLGEFKIVARDLDKVMAEHKFQRDRLTDVNTIVELGEGMNADYVVSGHFQSLGSKKIVSVSILHVESFQQMGGNYYEYDDLRKVKAYLPELAEKLVAVTKKDYSELRTLAIYAFDGEDENNGDVLAQLLAIELANSEKYKVVVRDESLEPIMGEHEFQRDGLTDENTRSEFGKATNADYVVDGKIGSANNINVSIINTSNFVKDPIVNIKYKTIEEGVDLIPVLCYRLTGVLRALSIEEALAMYEGEDSIEEIKALISKDVNAKDEDGFTPLMDASWYGYMELVKSLIAVGADLAAKNNDGYTALMLAATSGKVESVNMLILLDADLEQKDNEGFTALILAARSGQIEVVIALIEGEADIALKSTGITALMAAAATGQIGVIKALIERDGDLDAKCKVGNTALMYASQTGQIEALKVLIDADANLEAQDDYGKTALMYASEFGQTKALKTLIEMNADIDVQDDYGRTALIIVAYFGKTEVVKTLIDAGADFEVQDNGGFTALLYATQNRHTGIVNLLKTAGASE